MMNGMNNLQTNAPASVSIDERALHAVAAWSQQNRGRLPRLRRDDPSESQVCLWLAARSQNADSLIQGDIILLNRTFPDWRRVRLSQFDIRLYEVAVFLDRNGTLPSSSADDVREKHLAEWLTRKSSRAKDGTILLSEAAALDREIPGWRGLRCVGEARIVPMPKRSLAEPSVRKKRVVVDWNERVRELRRFVAEAHRTPLRTKPDEQVLARWVAAQQLAVRNGRLSDRQMLTFLQAITDIPSITLTPHPETFAARAAELADVLGGSRKITASADVDEHLRDWVVSANILYFRQELSEDQVASLDLILDEWREYRYV